MQKPYPAVNSKCFPFFVCQSDKLVKLRMCSGVISAEGVVSCCAGQRIHQCGRVAGFARILDCALGVIARSRRITKFPHTRRTKRQKGPPDIPARTGRKRTVFGRIENRERPVVVLFAIHKVARERQNVRESNLKLISSRRKAGVAGKVAIWSSARLSCSAPSASADRARERFPPCPTIR